MKKSQINPADYFYYDETSASCLRWKVERRSGRGSGRVMASPGDVAGTAHDQNGYAVVGLFGTTYFVHKIIWELMTGQAYGSTQVDHEDGNPSNNKIGNLRAATQQVNMRNRCMSSANTSGFTGVSQCRRKRQTYWRARWFTLDGKEKAKWFSISVLGDIEAFIAACEYRAKMIEQLNVQGAGYKERHGV